MTTNNITNNNNDYANIYYDDETPFITSVYSLATYTLYKLCFPSTMVLMPDTTTTTTTTTIVPRRNPPRVRRRPHSVQMNINNTLFGTHF